MLAVRNGKVWLDKAQLQEVYGAFAEQKFYSVEYVLDDIESVRVLAEVMEHYNAWARESYMQARLGNPVMPLTPELVEVADAIVGGEIVELAATLEETRGKLALAEDELAIRDKVIQLANEDINSLTATLHDLKAEVLSGADKQDSDTEEG